MQHIPKHFPRIPPVFLFLHFSAIVTADVMTDSTAKAFYCPDCQIPHDLEETAVPNFFRSFQKFSVLTEKSSTFTGPDSIENVITV
ncbi:MAG: hypothetical protein AB7S75_12475 [Desulfococcaceae bacterium]